MILENLFKGIFKNKKVFVTGHTGFQGSWLSLWLKLLGSNVIGYALEPPTEPSLFETLSLEHDINHIIGDLRDKEKLSKITVPRGDGFLIWFHVASVGEAMSILPLIDNCIQDKKIDKIWIIFIILKIKAI